MTDRKDLEKALHAWEERFRTLLENTNEYVMILQEGRIVYVNERLSSLSGPLPPITGMAFAGFIHKDDLPVVMEGYRKRTEEGDTTPRRYTIRIITRMGETRWVRVNSVPITWDDKGAILVAMLDVTDLKEAQAAADSRERQLREVTSRIPGVLYQFYARDNGERGLYFISGGSRQWFGLDCNPEGYLERFTDLVLPEYRRGFLDSIEEAVASTKEWRYEGKLRKSTGEVI